MILPVELCRPILVHIRRKRDLISIAPVSLVWQVEVEKMLWSSITLCDDSEEDLLPIQRLRLLKSRTGQYVQKLTLCFCKEALDAYQIATSSPKGGTATKLGGMVSQAIGAMSNLRHLIVKNNDEVAITLLRHSGHSFHSLHSAELNMQSLSTDFASFLLKCPHLELLSCSATAFDRGFARDYLPTLRRTWNHLTSLIASLVVIAPILCNPCPRLHTITVVAPCTASTSDGRNLLLKILTHPSVEVVCFGDGISVDRPLNLILFQQLLVKFPNLRELRRLSISEDTGVRSNPSYLIAPYLIIYM
jgi:hypothetical protein